MPRSSLRPARWFGRSRSADACAGPEPSGHERLSWVVLTQGRRDDELTRAIESIAGVGDDVVVVENGVAGAPLARPGATTVVGLADNVGVPAGRNRGVDATQGSVVGFLDDDARLLTPGAGDVIRRAFERDPSLGAVSFRIVDEEGCSSRRHVPRIGAGSAGTGGYVVNFLGGACAIRRCAFETAGRYWDDLFYAHEELELAWRIHDVGYRVAYLPLVEVFHPRTEISRHPDGWSLTGRNRVLIARRTLPRPVGFVHVAVWLLLGLRRAPDAACRRAYVAGWRRGWAGPVDRRPIRWRTVWRLTRAGRPPLA